MSAREFQDWQRYILEREKENHEAEWSVHREDYYAAQTAFWMYLIQWTIANMFAKNPRKPEATLTDFLLKFDPKSGEAEESEYVRRTRKQEKEEKERFAQERLLASKAAWGAFILGTTKDSPKQIEGRSFDES